MTVGLTVTLMTRDMTGFPQNKIVSRKQLNRSVWACVQSVQICYGLLTLHVLNSNGSHAAEWARQWLVEACQYAREYRTLGGEACQSKLLQLRNGLEGGALKAVLCLQSSTGCLINIDPARPKNSCWRHCAVMFSLKFDFLLRVVPT